MSKKHFIALADALRASKPPVTGVPVADFALLSQWQEDCRRIAGVCKSENYNFKQERWFGYINGECGPNGGAR